MLDIQPSSTPSPFDPNQADLCSDAELDALPFGVIALGQDARVLRYNLFESRLARLDRSQVLGRDFFREVARCARGDAFEGRFRRLLARSDTTEPMVDRFDFIFDVPFGAQEVTVEMVRAGGAPRVYLFVNRMSVGPARPEFPKEDLATVQAALAPDEAVLGVRRDALERRVVEIEWSVLSALRATCDRLAPESWTLFSTEWGVAWGRRLAVDLETVAIEERALTLRELPMRTVADLVSDHLRVRGWGHLQMDFADASRGMLVMSVARSALAESARTSSRSTAASAFACPLLAGCIGAILSHIAHRKLAVREVACVVHGAPRCELVGVGPQRRDALERAIASGARGVDAVRAALFPEDVADEALRDH